LPRRSTVAKLLAFSIFLIGSLVLLSGCGDSNSQDDAAHQEQLQRQLEEARRARKLELLERRLEKQKQLKAMQAQARRAQVEAETEEASSAGAAADGLRGFNELEESLPGQVGIAIGPPGPGPTATAGSLTTGSAWSTSKVPVAMRVLQEVGGPSGLSASQADEIRRALTLSDNEAALSLFGDLEAAYGGPSGAAAAVDEVLAEAGDTTTHVSSVGRDGFTPFGQTEWSLELQELFMSRLAAGCIGSPASSEYVLNLMAEVSSDTWGLGSTGLPARWKGGWGPGTDGRYLARQMGVLTVGSEEAVVTLAALPDDGSFETAQSMATSVAQWAAEKALAFSGPGGSC
jgi:hypothetical protein